MIIEEIEKQVINLLPTSNILLDEVDYSIIEERKNDWIKLSEVTHSVVLVFDCYTNKFVFVSNNIPKLYGLKGLLEKALGQNKWVIHYGL